MKKVIKQISESLDDLGYDDGIIDLLGRALFEQYRLPGTYEQLLDLHSDECNEVNEDRLIKTLQAALRQAGAPASDSDALRLCYDASRMIRAALNNITIAERLAS